VAQKNNPVVSSGGITVLSLFNLFLCVTVSCVITCVLYIHYLLALVTVIYEVRRY